MGELGSQTDDCGQEGAGESLQTPQRDLPTSPAASGEEARPQKQDWKLRYGFASVESTTRCDTSWSSKQALLTVPLFQTDSAKRPRRRGAGLQRGRPLAVPDDLRDPAPVAVRQDPASDREPEAQPDRAGHRAPPGALHPEVPPAPRRAGPRLRRAAGEEHRREVEAAFLCAGQQFSFQALLASPRLFSSFLRAAPFHAVAVKSQIHCFLILTRLFSVPPPFTKICAKHAVVKRKVTQRVSSGRKLGGSICCCLELSCVFRQ